VPFSFILSDYIVIAFGSLSATGHIHHILSGVNALQRILIF